MIDWGGIRAAVFQWAESTGVPAIWADQAAPKRSKPFVRLKISPMSTPAFQEIRRTATPGELHHCTMKEFSVSAQIFSNITNQGGFQHMELADQLVDQLHKVSIQALFRSAGCSIIDTSPVIDLTDLLDTGYEPKAAFDTRFYVSSNETEVVDYIESAEVNDELIDGSL